MELNTFATACYEQNSISELVDCLRQSTADMTDCKEWSIKQSEWFESIKIALFEKLNNFF